MSDDRFAIKTLCSDRVDGKRKCKLCPAQYKSNTSVDSLRCVDGGHLQVSGCRRVYVYKPV